MELTKEIPTPWRISDTGSAFKIEDAQGRAFVWVYYRREEALRNEYLSREQAMAVAVATAQLSR